MKHLIFTAIAIILFNSLVAQRQCGNCKSEIDVVQYDLDVQVAQPELNGPKTQGYLEWQQLFWISRHAMSAIFQANKHCIRFIQPPSNEDGELIVGATYANVPPPNKNLTKYGDYLLTGVVTKSAGGYLVRIELQTACSRKTIATSEVPFDISTILTKDMEIAQQAASRFTALIDVIKKFEIEEREKNKKLSFFQASLGTEIKINPKKSVLRAGESTDFTIELKDCDDVPLQGREISFAESKFEGFRIHGTSGGTVTPAKVVTDANGKATAKFTLNAGATEAIISAHSPGSEVKGCKSIFIGDAAINIKPGYSGRITYSFDQIDQCEKTWTSESGISTDVTKWNNILKVEYNASFYSSDPGFDGDQDRFVLETGAMINDQDQHKKMTVKNNPPTEQIIKKNQSGALKSGRLNFGFEKGGEYAQLNLNFLLEGTSSFSQKYLPSANNPANEEFVHSVQFMTLTDKNVQYKKTTSGGKIVHTITYLRTESKECMQIKERMELRVTEQ